MISGSIMSARSDSDTSHITLSGFAAGSICSGLSGYAPRVEPPPSLSASVETSLKPIRRRAVENVTGT